MTVPAKILNAASPSRGAFAPTPDCAFIFVEAGAFILDMRSSLFALDAASGAALARIVESGIEAKGEMAEFAEALRRRGLIEPAGAARTAGPGSGGRLGWIAARLARRRPGAARIRLMLALARLSLRCWGWPATFRSWRAALDRAGPAAQGLDLDEIESRLGDAASLDLSGASCKERALCAWMLARSAGRCAQMLIGVKLDPLGGHCWCSVRGRPLGDSPARIARYVPVLRYE